MDQAKKSENLEDIQNLDDSENDKIPTNEQKKKWAQRFYRFYLLKTGSGERGGKSRRIERIRRRRNGRLRRHSLEVRAGGRSIANVRFRTVAIYNVRVSDNKGALQTVLVQNFSFYHCTVIQVIHV